MEEGITKKHSHIGSLIHQGIKRVTGQENIMAMA
jgi:hypothetical protein